MRHLLALLFLLGLTLPASAQAPLSFRLTLSPDAEATIADLGLETPIHGRVYVVVTRNDNREPRLQTGVTGVPFWGKDVTGFTPGTVVELSADDADVLGYPLASLADLPPDTYHVQALLNVYTTFERADGHTLRMHLNSGAGQDIWEAPGNATSTVQQLGLDPATSGPIELTIDTVIPPRQPLGAGDVLQQGNPVDTRLVKYVKIRSEKLSAFWGRDMYIGANVLLPEGYDANPDMRYPTLYLQGHFPGDRPPMGFVEGATGNRRSVGFSAFWMSDEAPKMVVVTIRDANPYYDTAYSVNSANVGPYGDAIEQELIPYLESQFPMIAEGWARILAGGSTGGWEALAMQVFNPTFYGGCWAWCPDAVDFRYHQIVNIYDDGNAYERRTEWTTVERPNRRLFDGNIVSTMRQENMLELATGPDARSGGQWDIWEATYGPVSPDGYPAPIWDPVTGDLNPDVAAYWRDHYDLLHRLRRDWALLGPDLRGKIHVATGDMDSYYLDNAVYLLDDFLTRTTDPPADAAFEYGRRKPHCWIGYSPDRPGEDLNYIEFIQQVADYLAGVEESGSRGD